MGQGESKSSVKWGGNKQSHTPVQIRGPPSDDECRFNDPFFVIPKEIIRVVLQGFSRKELTDTIAAVSRRWRAAAYDPHLMNTFAVLIQRPERMTDTRLLGLVFNQSDRSVWDFTYCSQITNQSIIHLTTNVPRIVKFNLSCCKSITSDGILTLAEHFTSSNTLRELHLNWLDHLSASSLITLAASCPLLTHLSIRSTLPKTFLYEQFFSKLSQLLYINAEKNVLGDSFFIALSAHCHKLEQLFIDPILQYNVPEAFFTNCNKLKTIKLPTLDLKFLELNITELHIAGFMGWADGTFLPAVEKSWGENLTVLNLNRSGQTFTQDSIVSLVKMCQNLTYLDISETYQDFKKDEFQSMLINKHHLKFLGVRDVFDLNTKHDSTIKTLQLNNPGIVIEQ